MYDRPAPARHRLWMPVTAVVLAAAAVAGLWYYPDREFPNDYRSMGSWLAVILGVLAIALWLLFFSGMRWSMRFVTLIVAVVVVGGLAYAAVDHVEYQGNLVPIVHYRWNRHERGQHETGAQVAIPTEAAPTDFPEYRNRNRAGMITGLTLARSWPAGGLNKVWQVSVGGDVYSLGATGHLARLDGTTGKPKWTVDVVKGRNNIYWGQSGSPLVYDKFVVVAPGRNRAGLDKTSPPGTGPTVVAYDRDTGKVAWESGDRPTGYSSPELATIAGVRQVLVFDGGGLGSYDPETGKELWFHPWTQEPEANVAQPVVFDDGRVFISSGYGHGSAMLKVTQADGKWSVEQAWENNRLKSKFSNPVAHNGYVYGLDEAAGSLTCLDATTGKLKWKEGRYGNGQILVVGDLILVGTEDGRLVLVDANPNEFKELASARVLEGRKNWNYLTVAHSRAYVRNHEQMACYDLPSDGKK
jgi:outer membrane protein assembly factor BamB